MPGVDVSIGGRLGLLAMCGLVWAVGGVVPELGVLAGAGVSLTPNVATDLFSRCIDWTAGKFRSAAPAIQNHDLEDLATSAIESVLKAVRDGIREPEGRRLLESYISRVPAIVKRDAEALGAWEAVRANFEWAMSGKSDGAPQSPEVWRKLLNEGTDEGLSGVEEVALAAAAQALHTQLPRHLVGLYRDAMQHRPTVYAAVQMAMLQDIYAALPKAGADPALVEAIQKIGAEIAAANRDAIALVAGEVHVLGVRVDLLSVDVLAAVETVSVDMREVLSIVRALQAQGAASVSQPAVTFWQGRPISLGAGFVGRDHELAAIADAFAAGHTVVLAGGTGEGKSQLAAEYAHGSGRDGFWTPAQAGYGSGTYGDGTYGDPGLASTVAALAPALGIEIAGQSQDELVQTVTRRLHGLRDALWVVDNVPDLAWLEALRDAAGDGVKLLVITRDVRPDRRPGWAAFPELPPLSDAAARALLTRKWTDGCGWQRDDPALMAIVNVVGRLPLALTALAVELARAFRTPAALLAKLKAAPLAHPAFREALSNSNYVDAVYAALTGALEALTPGDRAVIAPLGYLADAPVPVSLFLALTALDEDAAGDLIERCQQHAVLRHSGGAVTVHALTAAVIAATNPPEAFFLAWGQADDRLNTASKGDPVAMRGEAVHYVALLAAGERRLGPEHPATLISRNNLATGYRALGRTAEAVASDEETLRVRERVLGPEHPATLDSRNNLAIGYRALGRTADAVALWEETARVRDRLLGPEHPETLTSRNNLAIGYSALGRTAEAVALWEETLWVMERVLGPEHPEALTSRNNLASGYRELGRGAEAVALWESALSLQELVLGPEHPDTLKSRSNLANGYRALGRTAEADALVRREADVTEGGTDGSS